MQKGKSGGAFANFVNAIINNKVNLKATDNKNAQGPKPAASNDEAVGGDLALIMQLGGGDQGRSAKLADKTAKPAVAASQGNIGLGYKATQAELESTTHLNRLKNQIRQATQASKELEHSKQKEQVEKEGKHGDIGRKKQGDEKQALIDDKREKKRAKKDRQKEKKKTDQHLQNISAPLQQEIKERDQEEEEEDIQIEERPRKRTKTRSKQKNKKRDNRPIEVKRAKLAERGIII